MRKLSWKLIKHEAPALLLLLVPFVVLPFVWSEVPAQMPLQWGWDGEVSRYGSKAEGLLLVPVIHVGVYLVMLFFPTVDPKRKTMWDQKPLPPLRFFIVLLLTALHFTAVASALGIGAFTAARLVPLLVTLLFLVMGNYLSALPPNYFVGIRTPWTLEDEAVWRKTHRLAGRLWVAVSAALLVVWLLMDAARFGPILAAGVALMAIVPIAYSFYLWKVDYADAP